MSFNSLKNDFLDLQSVLLLVYNTYCSKKAKIVLFGEAILTAPKEKTNFNFFFFFERIARSEEKKFQKPLILSALKENPATLAHTFTICTIFSIFQSAIEHKNDKSHYRNLSTTIDLTIRNKLSKVIFHKLKGKSAVNNIFSNQASTAAPAECCASNCNVYNLPTYLRPNTKSIWSLHALFD